ncbi:hypothetical protein [Planctomicrobium sp. SH664]|uniref:hypothetical protein n=1 Tax=Planctomicrobium sp. SH664 TaxID=3448125 RepID=UPI003F5C9EDA
MLHPWTRSGFSSAARHLRQFAVLLTALVAAGCGEESQIREYAVAKVKSAPAAKPKAEMPAVSPDSSWFLKLTGPKDEVLRQIIPFSAMLRTFRVNESGAPVFDAPEGWVRTAGPAPRYETWTIPGTEPPLEVTVSALPSSGADVPGYLLANLNRWRGQLGLEPWPAEGWMEKAREDREVLILPTDTRTVAFANLTGQTKEFGESRVLAGIIVPLPMPEKSTPQFDEPFTYTLPEGWSKSTGSSMRLASFAARHESGTADVSITKFPGGGDDLANVNRWRGQVSLEPIDEETLKSTAEKLDVDGKSALYVEAPGSEQSILAAIIPEGDSKWFFKMQGPKAAVAAETEHFKEFLKSVKFKLP